MKAVSYNQRNGGHRKTLCPGAPQFIKFLQPGIKLVPPAMEAQSPNHWTTREFSPNSHMISHKPVESVNLNIPLNLGSFLLLLLQIFSISFSLSSSSGTSTIYMLAFLILSHTSRTALWNVFILFLHLLLLFPSFLLLYFIVFSLDNSPLFFWFFLSWIVWDYNLDIVNVLLSRLSSVVFIPTLLILFLNRQLTWLNWNSKLCLTCGGWQCRSQVVPQDPWGTDSGIPTFSIKTPGCSQLLVDPPVLGV